MTKTDTKGIWIEVVLQNGDTFTHKGITSIAEAEYLMKRRYMNTPNMERVFLWVGTRKLGEYREDKTMTTFANFQSENPVSDTKFAPYAKQGDKETLVAFELPFTITQALERESNFKDEEGNTQYEMVYYIDLDTTNEGFKFASRNKEISTGYALTLPSNAYRVNELKNLILPAIQSGNPMKARLAKRGKAYIFTDVEK